MAVFLNKNSFHRIHKLPPFYIKTTFARIDFLRQDERLVDKKGAHNVKFIAKTRQNNYAVNTREWASVAKTCTLATVSVGGCRVYATYILYHETQKKSAIAAGFPACRECMEQLPPGCLLKYNHVLRQTNGVVFQVLSYPCPGTSYMKGCMF